ncbi:MAG: TetR/AcrR family transcriptional regulator [Propionibacteriaceae bacterium]
MSATEDGSGEWDPDSEGTPEGRRIIELLWNPPESPAAGRGPKPKLTLDQIVQAGIELADAEGLAALSMRKVAAQLGVGAMSLYTYLPGRSELVELMINRAYGEQTLPDPADHWRARLESLIRQGWHLYQAHPWLLDHNLSRLPLGPNVLDGEEATYAAIAAAGVAPRQIPLIANVVTWQLFGMARAQISDAEEARRTGVSTEAYYMSRNSFWVTHFDMDRYPTTTAIWKAGGFDNPEAADFDQQLKRLLDAIESLVARHAG